MSTSFLQRHASLLVFLAALCVWEAACRLLKLPEYIIPAPSAIFQAAREMGVALKK